MYSRLQGDIHSHLALSNMNLVDFMQVTLVHYKAFYSWKWSINKVLIKVL